MSTKKTIIRGVTVGWIALGCGVVVTFFTTPILLLGLGDATYGIWSIVMTLTGYYALADLGLGKATGKYIARFDGLQDHEAVRKILATTMRTYIWLASATVLIATVLAWLFPVFFDTAGLSARTVRTVVLLTGLRVAAQLLGSVYRAALIAHKRFDITYLLAIASQVSTATSVVVIIQLGGGLVPMAATVLIIGVLIELAIWRVATHKLRLPRFSIRDADRDTRKMLLAFGVLTVLAKSAQQLGRKSGAIIAGLLVGPASVAYFSVAESITEKCLALGNPIGQAAFPMASALQAQQRSAKLSELTEVVLRVLLALGLVFATIICFYGYQFVSRWISVDFADRSYLMFCLLALGLPASLPGNAMLQILHGLGQVRFVATLSVLEGLAVVGLAIPLTYFYGITGMACALLVATAVFRGIVQGWYLLRSTGIPVTRFLRNCVFPATASAVPVLLAALLVRVVVSPRALWQVILEMGLIFGVSVISTFFICLPSETRRAAISTLTGNCFGKIGSRLPITESVEVIASRTHTE